jgi:polysaccharide chain length determinant protein (PEP-CTERM system associated)
VIPGKQYTPDEILSQIWRIRGRLLAGAIVGAAVGLGLSFTQPDQYRSETRILVVPQRVPESYIRSTVTAKLEDRLKSISQQILSRSRLEQTLDEFDLYRGDRSTKPMDELIARLRRDIEVELERGDTLRVAYTSEDPELAMRVASRLASAFVEENLRDREVVAEGTTAFLDTQLKDALDRLVAQEKKLEEYRRAYAGELPEQREANQMALANAQVQMQSVMDALGRDRDRAAAIEREIADLTTELSTQPSLSVSSPTGPATVPNEVEQLSIARAALTDLSERYTPAHPDVQRAARRVRELEGIVAKLMAGTDPGTPSLVPAASVVLRQNRIKQLRTDHDNLGRQIDYRRAEEIRLRGTMQTLQARIDATPTRETELVSLTRDYETVQGIYKALLAKKEDSRIAANLESRQIGEQFRILDPATVPRRPFAPNRLRFALTGAGIVLVLVMAFVALLEYRNATLRTDDEVLATVGLPVLAAIPVLTATAAHRHQSRTKRALVKLTGAATLLLALVPGAMLV